MRYHEIVNELMGVKKFKDMTSDQVIEYLYQNFGSTNIEVLGTGSSGAAFKIGNSVYKMWLVDSAYTSYVKFCMANQNNKFLPKFLSKIKTMPAFFLRSPNAPDVIQYVKMEQLNTDNDINNYVFDYSLSVNDLIEDRSVSLWDVIDAIDFVESSIDDLESFLSDDNENAEVTLGDELSTFAQTLIDIRDLGYMLDLHEGNFALRGSQLVILDPIYDQDNLALNRELSQYNNELSHQETDIKPKPSMSDVEYRNSLKGSK